MRTALNTLREIIAADTTLVRESARSAAYDAVDGLEQLWSHLQRNYRWDYHHSWPAMCERALLGHLAVVAEWADQLPQPVPAQAREQLRDLLQVSELVSYFATGKIKTGEEKIYGLEIWNTRPVSFSTAPGLKAKADGLFSNPDGDYGWHIQPVDKKGGKVGYIFLFDSSLSEDELIWEPLNFSAEDVEEFLAEYEAHEGHNPLRDTMEDKRGRKLLAAVQEAVAGAPQSADGFDEWADSFKSPSPGGHLAYSAKDLSLDDPLPAADVAGRLAELGSAEQDPAHQADPVEESPTAQAATEDSPAPEGKQTENDRGARGSEKPKKKGTKDKKSKKTKEKSEDKGNAKRKKGASKKPKDTKKDKKQKKNKKN